nr:uncharacterized protein LOC123567603 isoform X4 [Macaca fascicularis]
MLLALKKTQSGQAGSTPASLQAWGTSFSPVPLLPAGSEPPPPGSSVPLLPASLSIYPDGLFLHCLPQLPGLCWSLGSTLTSASPSNAVDQASPNPTIPPKGAADQESSLSQLELSFRSPSTTAVCHHRRPAADFHPSGSGRVSTMFLIQRGAHCRSRSRGILRLAIVPARLSAWDEGKRV